MENVPLLIDIPAPLTWLQILAVSLAAGATTAASASPANASPGVAGLPAVGDLVALVPGVGNAGLRYEVIGLDERVPRKVVLAGQGLVQQGIVAPGGAMLAGSTPFKPQTKDHAFHQVSVDLKTGKQRAYWTSYYSSEYPAFSSDGRYLASVVWRSESSKAEIGVVDLVTGKEFTLPRGPLDTAYAPTWKPGAATLLVAGISQGSAAIYSISMAEKSWTAVWRPSAQFFSKNMDHHPTKDVVAFSGAFGKDRGAFLLDLRDGSVTKILDLATNRLRFSPRGDVLAFDTRIRGGSLGYYILETRQLVTLREFGDAVYPCWVHPSKPAAKARRGGAQHPPTAPETPQAAGSSNSRPGRFGAGEVGMPASLSSPGRGSVPLGLPSQ